MRKDDVQPAQRQEAAGVKIGGRIMYDVADLRAFIDSQKGVGHE